MMPNLGLALQIPSPLEEIFDPLWSKKGIRMWVKREDLIHPQVSGNKWRKLKYNIAQMSKTGKKGILTFGGAYSNHIYATAAAGHFLTFETIGIIRGEPVLPLNETLDFAQSAGMRLEYVSRSRYREKEGLIATYRERFPDFYVLPEGGTNELALPGCAEVMTELQLQMPTPPDVVCLACGTGGTMAGLIAAHPAPTQIRGFSVLKGDFHTKDIRRLLRQAHIAPTVDWQVHTDYHFGGYAKTSPALTTFIADFYQRHQIRLERIYTAKMMYGVMDLMTKGAFEAGTNIVVIHTGGLRL